MGQKQWVYLPESIIFALHVFNSFRVVMGLGTCESIAGEAAWEWRLWDFKGVPGWPCKCWQQQGASEQTVPVAHQPCSFQDFLQVLTECHYCTILIIQHAYFDWWQILLLSPAKHGKRSQFLFSEGIQIITKDYSPQLNLTVYWER